MGSVKVEISPLGTPDWTDLGPGEGAGLMEDYKTDEYIPDNATSYGTVLLDQIGTIDFMAVEPDFTALALARGGIDTLTPVAGTIQSGHTQVVNSGDWAYSTFIPFDLQNATGLIPTMDVTHPCLASTDSDLVEGTDFDIIKTGAYWGAVIYDSSTVTTLSQMITFKYSATPAAGFTLSTGGATEIGFIQMRLTNTDPDSKVLSCEIYRCQCIKGFQLKFANEKTSAKPLMWVLQFKALRDETRTVKDQLWKWTFDT